jgi:hypothetical protein
MKDLFQKLRERFPGRDVDIDLDITDLGLTLNQLNNLCFGNDIFVEIRHGRIFIPMLTVKKK